MPYFKSHTKIATNSLTHKKITVPFTVYNKVVIRKIGHVLALRENVL